MSKLTKEQQAVLEAAQAHADTIHATEHWRTNDTYPRERWSAAWKDRTDTLTRLIKAAAALPITEAGRAALSQGAPNVG